MNDIPKNRSVSFSDKELKLLWKMIVDVYNNNNFKDRITESYEAPETLSHVIIHNVWSDFNKTTKEEVSKISIGSKDGIEKEVSLEYFKKHLVGRHDKSFRYDILRRFIFYISGRKNIEVVPWLEENGFEHDDKIIKEIPSGLAYLEGTWLGINRNLEEHKLAVCFYKFEIKETRMLAKREAYSSEVMYEGEAFLQEDSSFMIHLKGRSKGRIKFIMANPKKVKPDMLHCFASAFSTISPQEPAIVKELAIKLPKKVNLTKGVVLSPEELQRILKEHLEPSHLDLATKNLKEFLGDEEEHVFTLEELTHIKRDDLLPIRRRLSKEKVVENLLANYRINHLGNSEKYKRSIVKYHKRDQTIPSHSKTFTIPVTDEYTITKVVKYALDTVQMHPISYKTQTSDGAVDILPLFPFAPDVLNNEKDEPEPRSSNLLIDARGDTFVSNATVINEFGKTGEINLDIEEKTLKTEIIIDFGAIENDTVSIQNLTYHFNEPDERGGEVITLPFLDNHTRTYKLKELDKPNKLIKFTQGFDFDPDNPKLYVIVIEFPMYEGDCISVKFNLNSN